jgi:hypothetical protein
MLALFNTKSSSLRLLTRSGIPTPSLGEERLPTGSFEEVGDSRQLCNTTISSAHHYLHVEAD